MAGLGLGISLGPLSHPASGSAENAWITEFLMLRIAEQPPDVQSAIPEWQIQFVGQFYRRMISAGYIPANPADGSGIFGSFIPLFGEGNNINAAMISAIGPNGVNSDEFSNADFDAYGSLNGNSAGRVDTALTYASLNGGLTVGGYIIDFQPFGNDRIIEMAGGGNDRFLIYNSLFVISPAINAERILTTLTPGVWGYTENLTSFEWGFFEGISETPSASGVGSNLGDLYQSSGTISWWGASTNNAGEHIMGCLFVLNQHVSGSVYSDIAAAVYDLMRDFKRTPAPTWFQGSGSGSFWVNQHLNPRILSTLDEPQSRDVPEGQLAGVNTFYNTLVDAGLIPLDPNQGDGTVFQMLPLIGVESISSATISAIGANVTNIGAVGGNRGANGILQGDGMFAIDTGIVPAQAFNEEDGFSFFFYINSLDHSATNMLLGSHNTSTGSRIRVYFTSTFGGRFVVDAMGGSISIPNFPTVFSSGVLAITSQKVGSNYVMHAYGNKVEFGSNANSSIIYALPDPYPLYLLGSNRNGSLLHPGLATISSFAIVNRALGGSELETFSDAMAALAVDFGRTN